LSYAGKVKAKIKVADTGSYSEADRATDQNDGTYAPRIKDPSLWA